MTDKISDIEFVSIDIEKILAETIQGYEQAYYDQTGIRKKLYPGDPMRIFLYTQALREFHLRAMIDFSAKQNLLRYATGNFLEVLAADRGVYRLPAAKARVAMKIKFSIPLAVPQIISAGLRVTPGKNIFFKLLETVEVPVGGLETVLIFECTTAGQIGNNFFPGQISILVDPIPYVESVVNIEESQGGADAETDNSLRKRTRLAPEGWATAGPKGAYTFHAKHYSSSILDVLAYSPSPGVVDIRVLLQGGVIPEPAFLEELNEYLSAKEKRPLTDHVQVAAPDIINYNLELVYYVSGEDMSSINVKKNSIEIAIDDYILWQKSKIGRNINPSKLISDMITAGASRVDVINPLYTDISEIQIAICQTKTITYGGIENA